LKYKRYLYLTLVLLIVVMAVGCQKGDLDTEIDEEDDTEIVIEYSPVKGGEVVLPLTHINTLNPLMTENSSYYSFSKLIFESLFEFDSDLNITTQLAEKYNIKDNGRTIEIELKDNIFWHDGEEFKAEDIAFTIDTIKYANFDNAYKEMFTNAMGSFSPSDLRRIIEVKIIDDNNIEISFDREFSNNLEVLTFPIIPKHKFANEKASNKDYIKALETNDYDPIGTGPYIFSSYEKMKQLTVVANENYRTGRPYIDKILGRVLESEEDILTAFETGQINMATTIGVDWEKYNQNKRIKILEFISSNYEFLGFNFTNELFADEEGIALRRAITYGIDRQAIIENLYLGHSTQIDVPIHPDSWLISESANTFGYNLDLAKSELKKTKWKEVDEDGFLTDEDGETLSLNILTNTFNPMRLRTAEMIKENLKELGININIIPEERIDEDLTKEGVESQWLEINERLGNDEYDIALLGWQLSVIPELSFAFHSSQIQYSTNFIKYSNEEMDQLLEQVFLSGIRAEKTTNYEELQKFITKELPYVSLFFKNKALLVDTKIMGELDPVFFNPYRGIDKCYIPKELQ